MFCCPCLPMIFPAAMPLFLATPAFAQTQPQTTQDQAVSAEDRKALQTLLETQRDAYIREDLSAYMEAWHPLSPYGRAREKRMRDLFSQFEKIEVVSFEFRDFAWNKDSVRVRVRSQERAVNAQDGKSASGFGDRNGVYECKRDANGAWKVWNHHTAEIDLATDLYAAKTAKERSERLDVFPDLIYMHLLSYLDNRGKQEEFDARYDAMVTTYTIYCEVAARSHIRSVEAIGWRQLGKAYEYRYDFVPAMNALQTSLAIAERQKDSPRIVSALSALGTIHVTLGNPTLAVDCLERARRLAGGSARTMAGNNLGRAYMYLNKPERALAYFDEELAYWKNRDATLTAEVAVATIHHNRSAAWTVMGKLPEALQEAEIALALREKIGDRRGIPPTLANIAEIHSLLGNDAMALSFLDRAELLAKAGQRIDVFQYTSMTRARILRKRNDRAGEKAVLQQAVRVIEELRASAGGGETTRQNFLRDKAVPYHRLAQMAVEEKNAGEALAWIERVRGRVLLDVLTTGRAEIDGVLNVTERTKEESLRRELNARNAALQTETQKSLPNASVIADQALQVASARAAAESYRIALYAAHPDLKTQRGEVTPITPAQASRLLPDSHSALLEYAVCEQGVFLLVLTQENSGPDLRAYPLAVTRDQLARQTNTFRNRIANRDPGFVREAKSLYSLLLTPAAKQLAGKTNLILAPDGPLWDLPFQALQISTGRFLLEDRTLSYTPSWTILREMNALRRKRQQEGGERLAGASANAAAPLSLLAVGNPSLSTRQIAAEELVYRGSSPTVARMVPLPDAEVEVKTLARFYGAKQRRVYVGSEAREGRVKKESPQAGILHFAAHAVLDDRNPLYSHIVLAQAEGLNGEEDGLLEARELLRLPLRADLAVLSACETARGGFSTGEGVIGLTWSLFIAGCPRVVVSQWRVDSTSTTDLMISFHRHLTGEPATTPAQALRQASLSLLKTDKWRHPFYWAPFVLIGDGSAGDTLFSKR